MPTSKKAKKVASKAATKKPAAKAAGASKKDAKASKAAKPPVKTAASKKPAAVAKASPSASRAGAKPVAAPKESPAKKAVAPIGRAGGAPNKVEAPAKKARGATEGKARFNSNFEEEFNNGESFEEGAEVETEEDELGEEEEETDVEGPPPWWKVDPTGIETTDDESESRTNFDDSDEWTEDDEDWNGAPGTVDRGSGGGAGKTPLIDEGSEDEDERW